MTDKPQGLFVCPVLHVRKVCVIFADENLSGARSYNRFNAFATPRHQRRSIILTVHLPTLNAISIRIIWKGFAAISITKIGGSLHHLSTFETSTVAAVRGFYFQCPIVRRSVWSFLTLQRYEIYLTWQVVNVFIFSVLHMQTHYFDNT